MDVVLEREVLGPELHAGPHDLVLVFEGRDQAPVERKRPDDRANQSAERDEETDNVDLVQPREPPRRRGRDEIGALNGSAHRPSRARKS